MRKTYKNKRDFYKAAADSARADAVRKQIILDSVSKQFEDYKKKIEQNKKARYSAMVYCTNCQNAGSVSIPNGVGIKESGCAWCGMQNCNYQIVKTHNIHSGLNS